MFNSKLKEESLSRLKKSENEYKRNRADVQKWCENLFNARTAIVEDVLKPVESYINMLARSPIELEKSVKSLRVNYASFAEVFNMQKAYSDQVDRNAATATGGGVAIGAGIGALAPTAAMAVATTFGTASTGAAIGGLSGAAATNAALAWLGGGSVAAGGGGMVAGKALLAMAGPIGWGIAGVAILGGSWWKASTNKKIAQKANEAAMAYEKESSILRGIRREVNGLYNLTIKHSGGIIRQLEYLRENGPRDYTKFSDSDALEMASLINNINSLSQILNRRIEV